MYTEQQFAEFKNAYEYAVSQQSDQINLSEMSDNVINALANSFNLTVREINRFMNREVVILFND